MSEEVHKTEEEINSQEAKSNQEFDGNEILARMEKLESTNNRLLEESKMWKTKYKGLSSDVEQRQQQELEKTENWKDLLEIEKNKRSEYETQLKETKKAVLQKELNFKVASLAKDAYDVSDIINNLPKEMISIDEESLSITGVDEAINFVREKKSHLFAKEKRSGMSSARPNGDNGKQTYEDLSVAEKDDMFSKALESLV